MSSVPSFANRSPEEMRSSLTATYDALNKIYEYGKTTFSNPHVEFFKATIQTIQSTQSEKPINAKLLAISNSSQTALKVVESIMNTIPGLLTSLNSLIKKGSYSVEDRLCADYFVSRANQIQNIFTGENNLNSKDTATVLGLFQSLSLS